MVERLDALLDRVDAAIAVGAIPTQSTEGRLGRTGLDLNVTFSEADPGPRDHREPLPRLPFDPDRRKDEMYPQDVFGYNRAVELVRYGLLDGEAHVSEEGPGPDASTVYFD